MRTGISEEDPRPDIQLHMDTFTFASDLGMKFRLDFGLSDTAWKYFEPHAGETIG